MRSGPSELMARVASILYLWEERGELDPLWLEDADGRLENAARAALPDVDALTASAKALFSKSRRGNPTFDLFVEAASLLQRLDEWHAPLLDALRAPGSPLDHDREMALKRLTSGGGAFNIANGHGSIIPGSADATGRTAPADAGVVAALLHETAFLPSATAAGDPDDSSAPSLRQVELRYIVPRRSTGDPRGPIGDRPKIAVAPVLEAADDAVVEVRTAPDRYGVKVAYDVGRLERIISKAMSDGAHLLFMPEMTVDADETPALASAIRRSAAMYERDKGVLPELRYVVAGLAHASGVAGNNSIVVMDVTGRSILNQEKLCRWNLRWYHQVNYGLRPACTPTAPDLKEDIPGGRVVWIADLEHLGRFLTLICADMDYDKPGDWLIRNVAVDWLHAPIMDKSIAWSRDSVGDLQPWIVNRANRAVSKGVGRVVVTNSVFLTMKLNEYNAANPGSYPVLNRCSIAFMLDASLGDKAFKQIEVDLPCPPLTVETTRWRDGFKPFPPP